MRYDKTRNRLQVSANDVRRFNATWPCSSIPEKSYWFEFGQNDDLVDTNLETDGPEVLALIETFRP